MTLTAEQIENLSKIDTYNHKGQFRCGEFACWTQGHFLIALKVDYDPNPGQSFYKAIPNLIAPDQKWTATGRCDVTRLLEWCTVADCKVCKNTRLKTCGKCDGDGEQQCECKCGQMSHTIDCEDCDGHGYLRCECVAKALQGRIFTPTYNRHLIRQALELSGAAGVLRISIQPRADVIDIRWPNGVICVMPLLIHEDHAEEFKFDMIGIEESSEPESESVA